MAFILVVVVECSKQEVACEALSKSYLLSSGCHSFLVRDVEHERREPGTELLLEPAAVLHFTQTAKYPEAVLDQHSGCAKPYARRAAGDKHCPLDIHEQSTT